MNLPSLLLAPAIMTILGLLFGVLLAVAYRFLRVREDPRVQRTTELLPGTNCGACGEPGCLAFAIKLVQGETQPRQCTVSSPDHIETIADYLGVDPGDQDRQVARLRCAGGQAQAFQIAEYQGFEGCNAAAVVSGGGKGCAWGCLGLGDCQRACTFDAIHMNGNGLPVVTPDRCTACGDCVTVCPKDLFVLQPLSQPLFVQCANPLAGAAVTRLCAVGCDACGKCAADAPKLIRMEGELPFIDYHAGIAASPQATRRCPTGAIQWLDGQQFADS